MIRTNHLDDRRSNGTERDENFNCDTFDALITKLLQKRPLGLKAGKTQLTWKNQKGYQAVVLQISVDSKSITFITAMQLNKKKSTQYEMRDGVNINLGVLSTPKGI